MIGSLDDEENSIKVKKRKVGLALFLVGFSMLMVVSFRGWEPGIFILSQIFMIIGIVIMTVKEIQKRKKNPVHEPKWIQHLRQ